MDRGLSSPRWSPAEDAIYFVSDMNGPIGLWGIAVDGRYGKVVSEPVEIFSTFDIPNYINIAPDGHKLIFGLGSTSEQLWRVRIPKYPANSMPQAKLLASHTRVTSNLEVSRDGSRIVIETTPGGPRQLRVLSLIDGSEYVLYDEQSAFAPTWSFDDQWVAFDAGGGNEADIWRIPASRGTAEKIIDQPGADWLPTYSPDGTFIAFVSNRNGEFNLWAQNLKTGELTQITDSSGIVSRGSWSHDSRRLAFFHNAVDKQSGGSIEIYDFATRLSTTIKHYPNTQFDILEKLVWNTDDLLLYFRDKDRLAAIDLETRQVSIVFDKLDEGIRVSHLAIFEDNLYFVSTEENHTLWLAESLR